MLHSCETHNGRPEDGTDGFLFFLACSFSQPIDLMIAGLILKVSTLVATLPQPSNQLHQISATKESGVWTDLASGYVQ